MSPLTPKGIPATIRHACQALPAPYLTSDSTSNGENERVTRLFFQLSHRTHEDVVYSVGRHPIRNEYLAIAQNCQEQVLGACWQKPAQLLVGVLRMVMI
jgi:hypothetical protein